MSESVFAKLKEDHRKVEKIFKQLVKTKSSEVDKREELFDELRRELLAHAEAEEKVFYPRFKDEKDTRDQVLEAYVEHHLVEELMDEMENDNIDSDEWLAKCKVLQELVKHHVEEEEEELFPKAKKHLDAKEERQLKEEVEQEEDEFKSAVGD